MLEAKLRPQLQTKFVDPIAKAISKNKFTTPNKLTLLGALTGIMIIPCLWYQNTFFAITFLCISGILDVLDGSVARIKNSTSTIGTVYDIVSDRLVELAIIFALFIVSPEARAIPCLFMLGSILLCVTSFLVVGIFSNNDTHKSFYYSPGLIERFEAFIFFAVMIALPDIFIPLAYVFSGLTILTTIIRLVEFRRQLV